MAGERHSLQAAPAAAGYTNFFSTYLTPPSVFECVVVVADYTISLCMCFHQPEYSQQTFILIFKKNNL
jgi:hypothetical protein